MQKANTNQKTKRRRSTPPERHRWVDQWLIAKGKPLRSLVEKVIALVEKREQDLGLRRRQRRAGDTANHRALIDVIVSNLAHAVLSPPPTGRFAISTRNTTGMTRYDNRAFGSKPLRALFEALDDLGLMERHYSIKRGEASSIWPLRPFIERVHEAGVTLVDFDRDPNEEVVVLARSTSRPLGATKHRVMIDYADTETTALYRAQVRRLNASLAAADITFEDDGLEPFIDCHQRGLRRHFTMLPGQSERFDQNGRLFGGFWMAMPSSRRAGIRINGERIAELDYSSMFTRLAYADLGVTPPAGDLYAIDGASNYRSGIKMAMNIFLFDVNSHRSKWPTAIGVGMGNDRDGADEHFLHAASCEAFLPAGWTVAVTRKAILKKHPALKSAWGRGLGYQLMFEESRLMLAVLESLRAQNIPALPLHDALLVPRSTSLSARSTMEQLGKEIVGIELPVSVKTK